MARKDKQNNSGRTQPNAPELLHVLYNRQPPHNPYYPDPTAALLAPTLSVPPPPYSPTSVPISSRAARNSSVPMSHMNDISYPRIQTGAPATVAIHSEHIIHDYHVDRYRRRIRSFNRQTILFAILSALLSFLACNLYEHRKCIDYVVHKPNKETEIKVSDVRGAHLVVVCASGFLVILCVLKSLIGFRGKNHSCFLFMVGLLSFLLCIYGVFVAYLAYYSPCSNTLGNILSVTAKTMASKFTDSLPDPGEGVFHESNVLALANEDRYGFAIFVVDVLNVIFYFSIFISAAILC